MLPRGRILGEIEEYFAETLTPGDTFLFAGEVLRFEGISEDEVLATRAGSGTDPMIPSYEGGKFPLSTFLAARVREILADPFEWDRLPPQMTEWLLQQRRRSIVPGPRDLLVETFPRANRYLHDLLSLRGQARAPDARHAAHPPPGAGRSSSLWASWRTITASRSMARATSPHGPRAIPAFWTNCSPRTCSGDDLEDWLAESSLMKRTFRQCAVIAGLIERRFPGREEDGAAGHDLHRSRLRRAAQARARPCAAAGRAGGCGNGTPRREAPRHDA